MAPIKFVTLVWYSAKQGTMHRPTSHLAHLYTVPFLWLQEEHRWQSSWVVDFAGQFVMATLELEDMFWFQVGVSNQNFTDGFLLEFDFFPGHCNRHLQWSALFTLLCMTGHSCSNLMPLRYVFYSDSKTDLKLWCDYCKKFQPFRCAQDVFSRLTAVCCMSLPHNPYRLPSTTTGTAVGPPVAVNINFSGYFRFLSISFVWIIWVQYSTDSLFGQQLQFVS